MYEEHKQTFPRFYVHGNPRNKITLFTDVYMHLAPLSSTLIDGGTHRNPIKDSKEILDCATAEEVKQYFAMHADQLCRYTRLFECENIVIRR